MPPAPADFVRGNQQREVAQGGLIHRPWRWSGSSGTGFESQSVVYGNPELLLASEVAFGCLEPTRRTPLIATRRGIRKDQRRLMAGYVQLVDALHTLKISRTDVRAIVDIVS